MEVISIPCPHFQITITQRSKGQSAVAGAAYQSGEKLFSEYDQKTKNYSGKRGIPYTEIMLPSHAPPEYANRETLWNSVEAAEKQWNAQLARRFVLALPKEVPPEQYPQMVRDYCEKQFVSKGMIADFAIHDPAPPGHNVHCHVMLTLRAMDEQGRWLPKSRKVYDLDENGRIPLRYFVNAGRTEYLYRTERSFIHQLNRWNTEDWEREQIKEYPQDEIITLTGAEPGFESEIEEMRAYEKGAWRLRITDMEVCGYIDRVLLPETGIQSYTMLDSRQLPSVINAVQRKFHVRDEQIMRCLGLYTMPNAVR